MLDKYSINEDFLFNSNSDNDEAFLINILDDSDDLFRLIGPSKEMFELIQENKTFDEVISKIQDTYDVKKEQVEEDLKSLIEDLVKFGVLIEDKK